MVCVCVCDFRSCRSIKPNLLTFPVILFPSHANPSSISITKLRYGLKNMANNRQERNMLYQNLQLGDFWILIMPRRVWWWTPKPLNKGRQEKRQCCQLRLMKKYWKWFKTCITQENPFEREWGYCWILCWMMSKYLQNIKLCQKKIDDSDSSTHDNSCFDERDWTFFL